MIMKRFGYGPGGNVFTNSQLQTLDKIIIGNACVFAIYTSKAVMSSVANRRLSKENKKLEQEIEILKNEKEHKEQKEISKEEKEIEIKKLYSKLRNATNKLEKHMEDKRNEYKAS